MGRRKTIIGWITLGVGLLLLLTVVLALRVSIVTDHFYHATVKDPERTPPPGRNIVAPADGIVMYVKTVTNGVISEIVKQGVPVPLDDFVKADTGAYRITNGVLIGIYMNVESVHVNRVPVDGTLVDHVVFNGPHMSMSELERSVILTSLLPGWPTLKKALGMEPYAVAKHGDYILKSARDALVFRDQERSPIIVVRIADYWVGRLLTWIAPGQRVTKGERLGMVTWGSQVDICFEHRPNMHLHPRVGDYVYAGETILATY